MAARAEARGLALPELLAAVALLAILVGLGAWQLRADVARARVESALRRLVVGLERGRMAARRAGRPCALLLGEAGWQEPEEGGLPACDGAQVPLQAGVGDGRLRLVHNFAGEVRFSSNGLVLDGGTVVVEGEGTELRRCLVMALPLGVTRVGRYRGAAGARPASGGCEPDPSL